MRFKMMCGWLACGLVFAGQLSGQDSEESKTDPVLAGHSYHGESFNEGPRQQAYLMTGLGRSRFSVSTDVVDAQKFFNQGVDQLHGFWYFEAERSFRQVVLLDPDCAMAFWGLSMANVNNEERAKEFIQQAGEKAAIETREVTEREKLYIEALAALYDEKVADEKKRAGNFADKLESLVLKSPDDIEAKAFLIYQLWINERKGISLGSHVAVNALLDQIFAVDPNHPAHHYRIHLWDSENAEIALGAAADCGPSLPDIAHMWHMPGHIYSKLKRYEDAVWQQEASARVDHRNMIHDQVLPDQIHNFAHNNEWCIRNLDNIGRVHDAIDLATNMISLPRHPKYNHIENRGSAWYGRQRLMDTLCQYELWQELIDACQSSVLEPTENELEMVKRLRYLGRAHFRLENVDQGKAILEQLRLQLTDTKSTRKTREDEARETVRAETDVRYADIDKLGVLLPASWRDPVVASFRQQVRREQQKKASAAIKEAGKEAENQINVLDRAIDELEGYDLLLESKFDEAVAKFEKAGEVDAIYRALILLKAGKKEEAIKQARKFVESHEKEVQPLALLTWLLWVAEEKDEALKTFEQLRSISGSIDLDMVVFERLAPVAELAGANGDWRIPSTPGDDIGSRPDLASLGPFRWHPFEAPEWELADSGDNMIASKQYQGKPVVVIFYLGHSCLHCAEQLQKFAPKMEEFNLAGIEMVAISTDDRDGLKTSIDSYGETPLPIQLLADPEFNVFRQYRVYDEFESLPLHGTFLIDGEGRVRWHDVSYEPFMEVDFLLKESVRLLSQQPEEPE